MSNFYCAAPWRGLHINPNGDVKTCCAGDPNMLGNLNTQTIEEILHGQKLQEIRQTLRQGKPHEYCYNCVQAERFGQSERAWHNNVSPEFDPAQATNLEHQPTLIDIRWNITCNLSCNYCGDKCSSKWAALKHIPFKSGARPYYEQVCDYLEEHKEHIREVALVGGEPLLLPENERLLDVIPNDCVVTLITNMSVDLTTNKIFKKLAQRNRVGWSMSFDNTGEQFEYVRYGGNWKLLENNLAQLKELFNQGHWGGIHAVYNLYNATCLNNFINWAKTTGIDIHWQGLYQPEYLDPRKHNQQICNLAAAEVDLALERIDLTDSERTFLTQLKENYSHPASEDIGKEFLEFTNTLESTYHPSQQGQFTKLWPEISNILNTTTCQ